MVQFRFLAAVVLAVTACAPAIAGSFVLRCDSAGSAAQTLCDSVRDEMLRRGYRQTGDAPLELVLTATSQPNLLRGRLDLVRNGTIHRGEEGVLTVIDRAEIPTERIHSFGRALLDRIALDSFHQHSEQP